MHNSLADDTQLPNGQRFDLLTLALLGVSSAADQLHQLTMKLAELKFDTIDYTCLKFLLLLNPGKFCIDASIFIKPTSWIFINSSPLTDAGGLNNYDYVSNAFNRVQRSLLDFCNNFYSHVPVSTKDF